VIWLVVGVLACMNITTLYHCKWLSARIDRLENK